MVLNMYETAVMKGQAPSPGVVEAIVIHARDCKGLFCPYGPLCEHTREFIGHLRVCCDPQCPIPWCVEERLLYLASLGSRNARSSLVELDKLHPDGWWRHKQQEMALERLRLAAPINGLPDCGLSSKQDGCQSYSAVSLGRSIDDDVGCSAGQGSSRKVAEGRKERQWERQKAVKRKLGSLEEVNRAALEELQALGIPVDR